MNGFITATDLMRRRFPEPRWAVPGLIAEGLNLLVGAPKFGKSWLCLGLAVSIASGGKALGKIDVQQGAVLYAALEDPQRRLQDRMGQVLQGATPPPALTFTTILPRMPDALDVIEEWLQANPDARLVIVDVFRKIRPLMDGRGGRSSYDEDYDTVGALKHLADRYKIAILLVHHTRKAADDSDVFNEVSGSTGLTGAADAILIAKRTRNTAEAVLSVTGRDINEQDFGLSWSAQGCAWSLLDEPVLLMTMGATRRKILDFLTARPGSSPKEIADGTGITLANVQQNVRRMVADDQLDSTGDGHYLPSVSVSAVSVSAPDADTFGDADTPTDTLIAAFPLVNALTDTTDRTDSVSGGSW